MLEAIGKETTPEILAIKDAITNIQTEMNKPMPPVTLNEDKTLNMKAERSVRKKGLEASVVTIIRAIGKLDISIKKCLEKENGAGYKGNPALKNILEQLHKQTITDRALFKEKVVSYRSMIASRIAEDEAEAAREHTWRHAWKYARAVTYDLDDQEKGFKTKSEGAGASNILVIEDPKKKEKIFFRRDEIAGGYDEKAFVSQFMESIRGDAENCDAAAIKALKNLFSNLFTVEVVADEGGTADAQDLCNLLTPYRSMSDPIKNITDFIGEDECTNEVKLAFRNASEETKAGMGKILCLFSRKYFQWYYSGTDAGIDHDENLTARNVATSRLAGLLGISAMVSDSRTAVIKKNGKEIMGNVMEDSRGEDVRVVGNGEKCNYSNKAIAQSFTLQVFDMICGQIDRHAGNFHVTVKEGEIKSVKAIDNDMSFGKLVWGEVREGLDQTHLCPFTESHIRAMPIAVINQILALKREHLDELLGDLLREDYLIALENRLTGIQGTIRQYAERPASGLRIKENGEAEFTGEDADDTLRMLKAVKAFKEDLDGNGGDHVTSFWGTKVYTHEEAMKSLIQWKHLTDEELDERIKARRMGGKIDPEENQA